MIFFWVHTIPAIIASILIIYLSVSCRLNKLSFHKEVAIVMALAGLTSLAGSLLYGFTLDFSFNVFQVHYYSGFLALILSLVPFALYLTKTTKWHYLVGDSAAVFASIALITGFLAYGGLLFPSSVATDCLTISDLESSVHCLVAVDDIVYDMTGMPRWQGGSHFDYSCGGSYYDIASIIPSHVADKYYGPVIGELCR